MWNTSLVAFPIITNRTELEKRYECYEKKGNKEIVSKEHLPSEVTRLPSNKNVYSNYFINDVSINNCNDGVPIEKSC